MQIPVRLAGVERGATDPGTLAAVVVSTAVLAATPLLIPGLIASFDLGLGAAGLISGVQLGGFVLTSFLAGRIATASRRFFSFVVLLLASANLVSGLVTGFAPFLATRFAAGLALGAITWLAWAGVFGDSKKMSRIAVVGPITGVLATPLIGLAIDVASYRLVYVALAVLSLTPLVLPTTFDAVERATKERQSGGAPAAFALIGALGLLTMGGSAVFVFSGVIATNQLGLSPTAFALILSVNAAAGIPAARWSGRRPYAGLWFVLAGACAIAFTITTTAALGAVVLVVWGFSFWAGVPGAYELLSRRSLYPSQRAGDAQAVMAVGRVIGPLVGGSLASTGSNALLGLCAGGAMIAAGLITTSVELAPEGLSPQVCPGSSR